MIGKVFSESETTQKITVIFETTPDMATVILKNRNKEEVSPKIGKTYSIVPRFILL